MFRRGVALALPFFLALAVFVPIAASARSANNGDTIHASMSFLTPKSLAGKNLKPGSYAVIADDTKITFNAGGKMVAEASIQWKDGAAPAKSDNIVTDGDQIREIHFRGKTRFAAIAE
jgi:hypothetical protein